MALFPAVFLIAAAFVTAIFVAKPQRTDEAVEI